MNSRSTCPAQPRDRARKVFAPCWSPRRITRSGSIGGPRVTCSGGHTFVHELHHLLRAIRGGGDVTPHGADFEDGYRTAEVCDAVLRSAASGTHESVSYRT